MRGEMWKVSKRQGHRAKQ